MFVCCCSELTFQWSRGGLSQRKLLCAKNIVNENQNLIRFFFECIDNKNVKTSLFSQKTDEAKSFQIKTFSTMFIFRFEWIVFDWIARFQRQMDFQYFQCQYSQLKQTVRIFLVWCEPTVPYRFQYTNEARATLFALWERRRRLSTETNSVCLLCLMLVAKTFVCSVKGQKRPIV